MKPFVLIVLALVTLIANCGLAAAQSGHGPQGFVTEQELQVYKDRIHSLSPERWKVITEDDIAVVEDPYQSKDATCSPWSFSGLLELHQSKRRHASLTDRGYYLIEISNAFGSIGSVADISPSSTNLGYGGCRITSSGPDFNNQHRNRFAFVHDGTELSYEVRYPDYVQGGKAHQAYLDEAKASFEPTKYDYVFRHESLYITIYRLRFNAIPIHIGEQKPPFWKD